MKTVTLRCVAVVFGLASVCEFSHSDDEGGPERVTALIKQLGDGDFARREAATRALDALGEPALAALRAAAAGSDDAEIRRRAQRLIAAITAKLDRTDVKSVPPPPGAIVLFDGKDLVSWLGRDGFAGPTWALLDGGVMEAREADIRTRQTFADPYKLHLEFRVPADPADTPYGRGNSGVYLHGNYEVQILDSHGQPGKNPKAVHAKPTESCGAIYGQTAPRVNACKEGGFWQSYDIEFHPARFAGGVKVEHPRLTVIHNGVLIHDKVHVLVDSTGSGLNGDPAQPGAILLQYHGSPVQFRNICCCRCRRADPFVVRASARWGDCA